MRMRTPLFAAATAVVLLGGATWAAPAKGDPLRSHQWSLDQIRAPQAWRMTLGRGVTVAVIDSGIWSQHPDLRAGLVPGYDFTGGGSTEDDCGHGTEVAGVIGARANNGIGVTGIAPQARIMPLRDGASCTVNETFTIAAIKYAVAHHARVINISEATQPVVGDALFDTLSKSAFQEVVDYAWAHGTLVVAGAGNSDIPICGQPASLKHVLCVGSVGPDGVRSYYSQGDATHTVDYLVAPGGGGESTQEVGADTGIWTTALPPQGTSVTSGGSGDTTPPPGYIDVSGTSFATPAVSAVAALLFSRGLTVQQVHDRILSTARDLGPTGWDPIYGYGEVDAYAALVGHR
jgi:subtilisin family serine protease